MKFTEIDYETALKLDLMLLEMEESLAQSREEKNSAEQSRS